jgi:hypothetical protein
MTIKVLRNYSAIYSAILSLFPSEEEIKATLNEQMKKVKEVALVILPWLLNGAKLGAAYYCGRNYPLLFATGYFSGRYAPDITKQGVERARRVLTDWNRKTVGYVAFSALFFPISLPFHVFIFSISLGNTVSDWKLSENEKLKRFSWKFEKTFEIKNRRLKSLIAKVKKTVYIISVGAGILYSVPNHGSIFPLGCFLGFYFPDQSDQVVSKAWSIWSNRNLETVAMGAFCFWFRQVAIPFHVFIFSIWLGNLCTEKSNMGPRNRSQSFGNIPPVFSA